jgi:predicted TIM-barrel fold metal-dependent hydrolase
MGLEKENLLLKDYRPRSMLKRPVHVPEKARFPVVDSHNHLWGDVPAEKLIDIMDQVGVKVFVNLTGNCSSLGFDQNAPTVYTLRRQPFRIFRESHISKYPGRFVGFTMSDFALWDSDILIKTNDFADLAIQHLEEDVKEGARGLKITKELGLRFKDRDGVMVRVDDKRLYPIWERAGELKIPVLIHTSDPAAFFLPIDEHNEHYLSLQEYPGWSFYRSHFSKMELLEQRNRIIAEHPATTFICAHVAESPEDLDYLAKLLDAYPNMYVDFSARIDELGRQPYTARDFMIEYQDRILFGTDMAVSPEMYRCHFRFLETRDEYFEYTNLTYVRWNIFGVGLPDEALRKIYYQNAQKIIPGLSAS